MLTGIINSYYGQGLATLPPTPFMTNFRFADDSGGVVNLIKHKVLVLILPTHSGDVIAIARSQPGGRSIRSILCEGAAIHLQAPLAEVLST